MKVFLLGLDGLTLNMVKPYIEAGLLPNLKKVLDEGAYGILRSTIPPVSGPAWVSLTTGKNPGKHGIFEFRTRQGYPCLRSSLENPYINISLIQWNKRRE